MKMSDVAGDHDAIEVVPGTRADSIARVDGRLTGAGLRAEIGAPRPAAYTDGFGESLAVRIRAGQAAEIAAVADRLAGDEECHRGAALETVLCESHRGNCT